MICTGIKELNEKDTQNEFKGESIIYADDSYNPVIGNVLTDTSDFSEIHCNDIVVLNDSTYLIRNCLGDEFCRVSDYEKIWVKSAIDLTTREEKIIKMAYSEKSTSWAGDVTFDCFRSPGKEARILALVKGHPQFMQGFGVMDAAGNIVRIIDYIPGMTMLEYIADLGKDHEEYFYKYFPAVLNDYIELVAAIRFLHDHGEKHGDISIDHVIRDDDSGCYHWIDFDLNYIHRGNVFGCDLFGLGNILVCLAGCGDVTMDQLRHYNPALYEQISSDDLHIVFGNRITNLKKVYPYIPEKLNRILIRLSAGGGNFYNDTGEFLEDLREVEDYLRI